VLDVRILLLGAALAAGLSVAGAWTAPAAAQGSSVVVIDVSYIFKHHVRFKGAQDAMKKEVEQYEESIRLERENITKMAEELKLYAPESPDYTRREEAIAERTSKLQLDTTRARKDFLAREAKLYFDTYQEVSNLVAKFAQEQGINLVLRFSSEPIEPDDRNSVLQGINRAVVYQNQLNITTHILAQVNAGAGPAPAPGGVAPGVNNGTPRSALGPAQPGVRPRN
jgi:Skp family chaperone for outer membrane proteins